MNFRDIDELARSLGLSSRIAGRAAHVMALNEARVHCGECDELPGDLYDQVVVLRYRVCISCMRRMGHEAGAC